MKIICNKNSEAHNIPEINCSEEFSCFIENDLPRLIAFQITRAIYQHDNNAAFVEINDNHVKMSIFKAVAI